MPVRIYSLAKELKIDSKELVELCTKAGLSGKASPLASLADDEVVRLKEFLANRASRPASSGAGADAGAARSRLRLLPAKTATKRQAVPARRPADDVEPDVIRREDYIAPAAFPPELQ